MADFVPCDRLLQEAYLGTVLLGPVETTINIIIQVNL